ncbi:MAG: hypothetical protein M3082_07275 [Candidatus Dormibacteraeota bacterium]|nr:hypothetical protein [Candidatus Dormibacteraeota bacterium]
MSESSGPKLGPPDVQHVALVRADEFPLGTGELSEAVEVVLSSDDGVSPEQLADYAVGLVAPSYFVLEERRSLGNWGATGIQVQDIFIAYAAGVGSGLTVEAIRASLSSLIRGHLQRGQPETAESAWHMFGDSLIRSFKLKEHPIMESVEKTATGWAVTARAGAFRFDGTLDADGRLVHIRRVGR